MMGHQQGGPFLFAGEGLDEGAGGGAGFVVERGERLVEKQHRLVAQQRAGEGNALLLAAREGCGALAGEIGETEFGEGGATRAGSGCGRPRATLRAADRCSNSVSDWKRIETGRRSGGSAFTVAPPMLMVPAAGSRKPATRSRRVDLPDPLAPRIAVTSPAFASIVKS